MTKDSKTLRERMDRDFANKLTSMGWCYGEKYGDEDCDCVDNVFGNEGSREHEVRKESREKEQGVILAFIESQLALAKKEACEEVIEEVDSEHKMLANDLRTKFLTPSQDATRHPTSEIL